MLIISSSCIQHYLWLLGGLPRKLQTEHIAAIETAVLKILSHLKISLYHRSLTGDTHTHTDCERFPNVSSPCSSPLIHPWLIKDNKLLLPTAPSAGILLCFPSVLPAFYSFLWREQQSVERTRANHVTSLLLMSLKTTVCENILVLREKKRMESSALFLQMMNEYPQLLLQDK